MNTCILVSLAKWYPAAFKFTATLAAVYEVVAVLRRNISDDRTLISRERLAGPISLERPNSQRMFVEDSPGEASVSRRYRGIGPAKRC